MVRYNNYTMFRMLSLKDTKSLSGLNVLGLDFSLSFSVVSAPVIVGLQEEETFLVQSMSNPSLGNFYCN